MLSQAQLVIVTNRIGKVAQRNSFGYCWRQAVADARICGKPPASARDHGQCGETCADPAHCLPMGTFPRMRKTSAGELSTRFSRWL